jgi:hypothetical protein
LITARGKITLIAFIIASSKSTCIISGFNVIVLLEHSSTRLANDYKNPTQSGIGKWLTGFFGLVFLPSNDVENSFVEDFSPSVNLV